MVKAGVAIVTLIWGGLVVRRGIPPAITAEALWWRAVAGAVWMTSLVVGLGAVDVSKDRSEISL